MTKHDPDRPEAIVEYITDYYARKGVAPSIRQVMRVVDLATTSAVYHWLVKLEKQGRLVRNGRRGWLPAQRPLTAHEAAMAAVNAVLMDEHVAELSSETQDAIVAAIEANRSEEQGSRKLGSAA